MSKAAASAVTCGTTCIHRRIPRVRRRKGRPTSTDSKGERTSTAPSLAAASWEPRPTLFWSIGAIDRNGNRLANARSGAEPPLVAYGDHAAVEFDGQFWTEPLTGSSVGAAVASSLAALAWHIQPDLDRMGVMALLESSAHRPKGRSRRTIRYR